jgi:hypothetical protein
MSSTPQNPDVPPQPMPPQAMPPQVVKRPFPDMASDRQRAALIVAIGIVAAAVILCIGAAILLGAAGII